MFRASASAQPPSLCIGQSGCPACTRNSEFACVCTSACPHRSKAPTLTHASHSFLSFFPLCFHYFSAERRRGHVHGRNGLEGHCLHRRLQARYHSRAQQMRLGRLHRPPAALRRRLRVHRARCVCVRLFVCYVSMHACMYVSLCTCWIPRLCPTNATGSAASPTSSLATSARAQRQVCVCGCEGVPAFASAAKVSGKYCKRSLSAWSTNIFKPVTRPSFAHNRTLTLVSCACVSSQVSTARQRGAL